MRTTFELIEKGSKLSSKPLEDALNEIRKNFTPSLGKDHGRVVLKAVKPDELRGQSLNTEISEAAASRWLHAQLDRVFPRAESLIQEMKLDERYKDVTFETLNRKDFLQSVKEAFPYVDWDKAYSEFKAAGQRLLPQPPLSQGPKR